MIKRLFEILISFGTATITWLALSYVFLPIKLSAPANEYFVATITHMVPLKTAITILFVLTVLFLFEQSVKKNKNK